MCSCIVCVKQNAPVITEKLSYAEVELKREMRRFRFSSKLTSNCLFI